MNDNRNFRKNKAWMLQLLEWGLPSIVIQKVLDISPSTVINYLENFQESGEWRKEINRLDRPQLLFLYAQIKHQDSSLFQPNLLREKLSEVLAEILEEKRVVQCVAYALPGLLSFTQITYTDDVPIGYQRLIDKVFPRYEALPSMESVLWLKYLYNLTTPGSILPDSNQCIWGPNHFVSSIIQEYAKNLRDYIAPICTNRICVIVNNALEAVSPRAKLILQLYCGIYSDCESLEHIGQKFDIEKERVHQIKEKTLRKLKQILKHDLNQVSNAWEEMQLLKERHQEDICRIQDQANKKNRTVEEISPITPNITHILLLSIHDLDLSIRAYNGLLTADIKYMWELVQLSSHDISKLRYIGKKSIEEIENVCIEKGVSLEMVFPDTELDYFRQRSK